MKAELLTKNDYICRQIQKWQKNMIRSIPNPPMDKSDVKNFRTVMRKCIKGEFSVSEHAHIENKKADMQLAEKIILKNNGGKNPILGF